MSAEYCYLEVYFHTNRSGHKGSLEKLRNSLNEVPGATLATGYDNGARFLLHVSRTREVLSAIAAAGFGIVQSGKFDNGTLLLVINNRSDISFSELDNSRVAAMWD